MKRYLFMTCILLVGITFANNSKIGKSQPLENFSVSVTFSSTLCGCGVIEEKLFDIEIWDIHASPDVLIYSDYDVDITNESSPYTYNGAADILWNCQGCYKLKVQIEYYDNEGKCCDGANFKTCDGEDLINGESISVTLNYLP